MAGVASVLGLIVGIFLGAIGTAHAYGDTPTFAQGGALALLTVAWLVFTAVAIAGEESEA